MEKNIIKKFAVWARNELIARVTQKAEQYEITEKKTAPADADSIGGRVLTVAEKKQRQALIAKINQDGFEQVMEEVAYTWFNRFTALRFMEVNNYLPSHTRVFTNENGEFKPQILADAIQLDLEGLNMDKVFELKDANKTEELYKYLLITQCNALSSILPRMFQKIEDYTELLLPDYLLRKGSVIEQMIDLIPEADWKDAVQIIGWLYQYYNTEPKDKVFADLKKNIKITKENIPAATQLFTPDWIVHYMVENTLGRLWLEGHPNDALKSEWKYYLDEAEQEPEVQEQLATIWKEYAVLKPEEIRVIDPCMGSGHILCVLFDVLVRIYEDYGYTAREAAVKIVENNLWGLDIDERAAQLSYFAVMMKARQYDRRFFTRKVQPHVYAIEESNGITSALMHYMGLNLSQEECSEATKQAMQLIEEMHDAKEYGSIINVTPCDWNLLRRFAVPREEDGQLHLDIHGEIEASARIQQLINIGEALAQKYHAVVTNPPYLSGSGMGNALSDYVRKRYPNSKSDLFAVFIERCSQMAIANGYHAMITMQSWMFLKSYEKMRSVLLKQEQVVSLLYLGIKAFEEIGNDIVQTVSFVIRKSKEIRYRGNYFKLITHDRQKKIDDYLSRRAMVSCEQASLFKVPGAPIAFWVSEQFRDSFSEKPLGEYADIRSGMSTTDNERFLRFWFEPCIQNINFTCTSLEMAKESPLRWYPYNKGGDYRKWYGNNSLVVNWLNDGAEIKKWVVSNPKDPHTTSWSRRIFATDCFFKPGITWSSIASSQFGCRDYGVGFIFDSGANGLFPFHVEDKYYILGLLNSKVAKEVLDVINPSINFGPGTIGKIPAIFSDTDRKLIESLVSENITLAKEDWDDYETSWGFIRHPLITSEVLIEKAFLSWNDKAQRRYEILKDNEEKINTVFISIYGLIGEVEPEIEERAVSVRKANLQRDVKSLISYAVGCMFGRYSLDIPGLVYAGGEWDASLYTRFQSDIDAIIPICDDEYFEDDILGRFVKFVEVAFGEETLEENLHFIADSLGGKGSSRDIIRNYFINDFYADHLKVYQKRPIYWLFDSGKKNGFKALIYMHRYQPDTIARIRTDYIHEQQSRYRTAIADLEKRIDNAAAGERVKLNKELNKLQAQAEEIRIYEEKIHHLADQMISIDLDDGVKHNYAIFKDVLAKIK